MTERELVKNLSALQSVRPNRDWVKRNREVLSYQIFNGAEYTETHLSFYERFSLISKRVLQPTPIAALIAIFLLVGGVFASKNIPADSPLYIAKTISERAQLAATFDETAKARLNLEFASQRAAEAQQINTNSEDQQAKNNQLQQLSSNFKQEIDSARARISKIKPTTPNATPDDSGVVSAQSGKDDKGIQVKLQTTEQGLQ